MMRITQCLFVFVTLLLNNFVHAQLPDTARLKPAAYSDSTSIRKLIDSAFSYKEDEPIKALFIGKFAYDRAVAINNKNLQAGALNLQGTVYSNLRDHQSALSYLYQSLRLFESTGYPHGIAMSFSNIARVFSESGKTDDAFNYLLKGETICIKHKLDTPLLHLYLIKANTFAGIGKFKEALNYAFMADSLNQLVNIRKIKINNDNTIGALYYFMNDFNSALQYYNRSKTDAAVIKDSTAYYQAHINIGEVYEITKQQDPLSYYMEGFRYFERIGNHDLTQYAANNISNFYKAKGNHQLAFDYYQRAVAAANKTKNIQATRNMQLLQMQYETEKKEQQISLLNHENTIQKLNIQGRNKTIIIISGLFIITVVVMLLLYNRYRYKQRMLLQEKELNQREVLTKAVIEAEEKERKRIASDLHDGVGQLFSAVKMNLSGLFDRIKMEKENDRFLAEKTLALVDESCKEVRMISHQMMPNMLLRSGIASDVRNFIEKIDSENLKVNLEANGFKNRIESNAETVLYRVIQESVNNVIKHSKATRLDILLNRDETGISVLIADNGVGFDASKQEQFEGIGLKNIKARIEYLKGTVRFDSSSGNGSKVNIWVPL